MPLDMNAFRTAVSEAVGSGTEPGQDEGAEV